MSFARPLRGGCHCGRNRYIIFPQHAAELPQVLFNQGNSYSLSHTSSPLSAYLRVPLQWYFSTTLPLCPDETTSMISRVYPTTHEQRRFCGFCGTPLSYWSEEPQSEAKYIQLALGTLFPQDLADLEDLGFIPSPNEERGAQLEDPDGPTPGHDQEEKHSDVVRGVSWLDALTEGSRLGTLRHARGSGGKRDGVVKVEWEVVEWTADDEPHPETHRNGKRKLADRESDSGVCAMEGVLQQDGGKHIERS